MRGRDPDSGEFHSPSRSEQRRQALDVLALAQQLAELSDAQLGRLPLPEHLLPLFLQTRRITAHVARKRQIAYVAKQLRREDDAMLEAVRDALSKDGEAARQETALLHRAERWRDRLLDEGDDALAELLDTCPQADRQQLRQLLRNTAEERARSKPPRAYRQLFRTLRELLGGDAASSGDNADNTDSIADDAEHDKDDDQDDAHV